MKRIRVTETWIDPHTFRRCGRARWVVCSG